MFGFGGLSELMFIFFLAMLIFGPEKLPEIGRMLAKGMAEVRKASNELKRTLNAELAISEQEIEARRRAAAPPIAMAPAVPVVPVEPQAPAPAEAPAGGAARPAAADDAVALEAPAKAAEVSEAPAQMYGEGSEPLEHERDTGHEMLDDRSDIVPEPR